MQALGQALDRYFGFGRHRTTLARDSFAGATTFIVMSYIIFVNPTILTGVRGPGGETLPFSGVLTSTSLVAAVMTILMGLYTNRAYALAPGSGSTRSSPSRSSARCTSRSRLRWA